MKYERKVWAEWPWMALDGGSCPIAPVLKLEEGTADVVGAGEAREVGL